MFLKVSTTELKRIVPLIRKKLLELRSCMTNRVESNLKFCKLYSNQLVKSIPLDTLQEKIFFGIVWYKLFKSEPSKIRGKKICAFKKFEGVWSPLGCLSQVLLDPLLNTLSHLLLYE